MLAMTRYYLALLGHSQRYLPAILAYLAVNTVLYTDPKSPLLPQYGISAGSLLVVSCWLTIALLDIEDPVQRLVTFSHARRWRSVLGGAALAVFGCAFVLIVVTLAWSMLRSGGFQLGTFALGAGAHALCALFGIAIGLPCSRLLVPRIGWSVLAAIFALAAVLLVKWLPLANPLLRALTSQQPLAGAFTVAVVAAIAAVLVSMTVVGYLLRRNA
ncbi:hypothetical protein [Amycolatopsis regifaucium]|uniref:ABC transporter n=1 Tax=Amycolatopsis regifaucium TaxID=546365 RepID=A0A154MQ35_9PSEU|nr:hypothetical protein [Amycolatopsis regifaucium]KZB86386.1 hypothetical protein AVL48_26695 [Amycolatopsis regifaucium]OKA06424.1 hypothetical protein ATP06_0225255 [Amycolatopsis regifaucium]SFJ27855.1 hypothetical protein SAMN04489731_11835 [Amycolatopsis regifaucium]